MLLLRRVLLLPRVWPLPQWRLLRRALLLRQVWRLQRVWLLPRWRLLRGAMLVPRWQLQRERQLSSQ